MKKAGIFKKIWEKEIRNHKLRSRVALSFFGVVFVFMLMLSIVIFVAEKFGFSLERLRNPLAAAFTMGMLCIVLATVVAYYLMRKIFVPLEQISAASKKVAEGDFSVQLSYKGKLEELENTIQNFNRMVRELDSVEIIRNDFITDVSHEFKTPLAAISGYATFLQDPELSLEERNEYIRKILFNINRLNDLTENILRLSKLEHQQFLDEPDVYRLDEQIREAIVLLEPKWGPKRIELDLDLPELNYRGYRSLLFQVWVNIIGNAVKYTEREGSIAVYLRKRDEYVNVIISDNGIGMSEETQAHIFDKFYQGDTSRRSQGNGLGLALCKEIVKKCGGEIFVESTLKIGSVFIVKLPINETI